MASENSHGQGGLATAEVVPPVDPSADEPAPFLPLGDNFDVLPSERYQREHGNDPAFSMPEGLNPEAYVSLEGAELDSQANQEIEQDPSQEDLEEDNQDAERESLEDEDAVIEDEEQQVAPVSYPLNSTWVLWYDSPQKSTANNWGENMKEVVSFNTAEEFWGIYNNIIPCSRIPNGANYYLFRQGIKPEWEDPANKTGGKWQVSLPNIAGKEKDAQDAWLYAVLSAIGESYEDEDMICGLVAANRKQQYRIAMWIRCDDSPPHRATTERIGRRMKEAISSSIGNRPLEFTSHQTAMVGKGASVPFKV